MAPKFKAKRHGTIIQKSWKVGADHLTIRNDSDVEACLDGPSLPQDSSINMSNVLDIDFLDNFVGLNDVAP
jgi:hypothetical protein